VSHLRLRLLTAVAALIALAGAGNALAAGDGLVISQVYGGGGNTGATYSSDYIELYNPSSVDVPLTGLSLQYASATGTGAFGNNSSQLTELSGTIKAGKYFLVGEASGGATGAAIPTADLTDPTPINMSGTAGKVALVTGTATLACNGGSTACPAAALARIVDLVGYGNANFFEGAGAAPTLSNTTAALRKDGGAVDTNNNSADFVAGPPNPRNGDVVPPPPPPPFGVCGDGTETAIHAIQGASFTTPDAGLVRVIEGVVTGDFDGAGGLGGYFVQEEDADADSDPLTSEGIVVAATSSSVPGEIVRLRGTVGESFGHTQLSAVDQSATCGGTAAVSTSSVNLPVASFIGLEQFEGMLTSFGQTLSATETFTLGRFGEVSLSSGGRLYTPTQLVSPGAAAIALQDLNNRNRIQLDDNSNVQNPPVVPYLGLDDTLRIGDTVAGLTGVLSYGFGLYRIQPTAAVGFTRANPRPAGPPSVGGSLRVAGANVLNYFTTLDAQSGGCGPTGALDCRGANTALEFERQRTKIVAGLKALNADILGLTELENNATDGPIANLVAGLNEATAPGTYAYLPTGPIGTDAIRVGIIYKPAAVTPVGARAVLNSSVDPDFDDTKNRPALAQTFRENGTNDVLTIAVNHLKSKGSDCLPGDPDTGDGQGNCNLTRTRAANALVEWLATDPTASGSTDYLIVGDLNSYAKEDPIQAIEAAGYTNLVAEFVGEDAYSYVFQGQSGTLDYALASESLADRVRGADEYHINADEPVFLDYNTEFNPPTAYKPDGFRTADHDPVLAGICETTAPTLAVSLSRTTLSPPNHKYVTVDATVTATDKAAPTVTLVSVTSDEPDNGDDDGDTIDDVVIVDQDTFKLRAERSGVGDGRVYTVTYRATDACGNSTVKPATVTVPLG
jgi:predicted extracellular nuclease